MRRVRFSLLLLCVSAAFSASPQTMYKWVDEKGVTHFSENPPPDGTKGAAKIEVKPIVPDKAPVDNWKQRELESKQRRAMQGLKDETARRQDEAQRGRRCSDAKQRVDTMTYGRRIYNLNDKGERVYIDDSQRAKELEEAKREIARSCP